MILLLMVLLQITLIKIIFKNCTPFTNCISKINNTQIDNAEYVDIVNANVQLNRI